MTVDKINQNFSKTPYSFLWQHAYDKNDNGKQKIANFDVAYHALVMVTFAEEWDKAHEKFLNPLTKNYFLRISTISIKEVKK